MLVSRQGKVRLSKWYEPENPMQRKDQSKVVREVTSMILSRSGRMCNVLEYGERKIIYKRYASLYFAVCISDGDNELLALEKIHLFVEVLDRYFGNVCELDIIFNFHKAYYILNEVLIGGQLVDSSKKRLLETCMRSDDLSTLDDEDI